MNRIVIASSAGRAGSLHALPKTISVLSPRTVTAERVSTLGSVDTFIPGLCVPSCNSGVASTVCVHKVKTHDDKRSVKLCISGIPCLSGDTFSFRLGSVRHVRILQKPRKALCKHGTVKNVIGVCALSPFSCRKAGIAVSVNGCKTTGTGISRCDGVKRGVKVSLGKCCSHGSNFFVGRCGNAGTSGRRSTNNQFGLRKCVASRLGTRCAFGCSCMARGTFPCKRCSPRAKTIRPVHVGSPDSC